MEKINEKIQNFTNKLGGLTSGKRIGFKNAMSNELDELIKFISVKFGKELIEYNLSEHKDIEEEITNIFENWIKNENM